MLFIVLFVGIVPFPAVAQHPLTMFNMDQSPQANSLNPALQPRCKIFIGLPVLATVQADYHNNIFSYNNLVDGDALALDAVYDRMTRTNLINMNLGVTLFSVGYRYKKDYFTFSVTDRVDFAASFPRSLASVLLYGNEQFIGRSARVNNTRVGAKYFREYAVGWSYHWDEYTNLGIRGKLLFGKANLHTSQSLLRLGTDDETYALNLSGDVGLNSSFPVTFTQDANGLINGIELQDIALRSFLLNPRNPGLAFDMGVVYKYSDEITLSASALDLGAIFWTDQRNNIQATIDYSYDGIREADFTNANYILNIYDSIYNNATFLLTQDSYATFLPSTFIAGGKYHWKEYLDFGITGRVRIQNRSLQPALTASAITSVGDWLQAAISWSYMDHSLKNVGAAIAFTGRGFQFYMASDNVMGYLFPYGTRTLDLRFGMNLMLGCPGSRIIRSSDPSRSMVPCPPGQNKRKWFKHR
jgi:hypothetical protein